MSLAAPPPQPDVSTQAQELIRSHYHWGVNLDERALGEDLAARVAFGDPLQVALAREVFAQLGDAFFNDDRSQVGEAFNQAMEGLTGTHAYRFDAAATTDGFLLLVHGLESAFSCASPPPLSPIGEAVQAALETHGQDVGPYRSELTTCNALPEHWLWATPLPGSADVSETEAFYQMLGQEVALTQHSLDIINLTFMLPPDVPGGEEGRSAFAEYLAPGLRALHERLEAEGGATVPVIRLGFADGANGHPDPEQVMQMVAAAMVDAQGNPIPPAEWNFRVEVLALGSVPDLSNGWNHTKLVVRDDAVAVAGGHTFYNDWLDAEDPRYDVSMSILGQAAEAAGRWVDATWSRALELGHVPVSNVSGPLPAAAVPGAPVVFSQGMNVFSLVRGPTSVGTAGMDYSADRALVAAIGAAQDHVFITQHMMLNPNWAPGVPRYSVELFDALSAALLRGVEVKVLISDPWRVDMFPNRVTPEATHEVFLEHFAAYLAANGPPGASPEVYLSNLELATFHASADPADVSHNHAKLLLIDDQAFYIGSQNLYPSGITSDGSTSYLQPELGEQGFLVDDAASALTLRQQYWDPLWALSSAGVVGGE